MVWKKVLNQLIWFTTQNVSSAPLQTIRTVRLLFVLLFCFFCYQANATADGKTEESFAFNFFMDYNHTHGVVCLISWFWTVFICLVLVILAVQATTFRLSSRYRFKRLKRLIPSVDEQVRLFREDLNLSLDLEFMEFDIVDRNSKKTGRSGQKVTHLTPPRLKMKTIQTGS